MFGTVTERICTADSNAARNVRRRLRDHEMTPYKEVRQILPSGSTDATERHRHKLQEALPLVNRVRSNSENPVYNFAKVFGGSVSMCARFEQQLGPVECQLLLAELGVIITAPEPQEETIRPTDYAYVVSKDMATRATFGLRRPRGPIILNARSETIHERPTFRRLLDTGRALIPMNSFYEPGPVLFSPSNTSSMLLAAGLIDLSNQAFVILTRDADRYVRHFHERMPVLSTPDDAHTWLDDGVLPRGLIPLNSTPDPAPRGAWTRRTKTQPDELGPLFEQGRFE